MNRRSFFKILYVALLCLLTTSLHAKRTFVHPGLTYTQADLDRMKAMVEAKQEPFYATFLALQASGYSQIGNGDYAPITSIAEGRFNGTIGGDGRRAHDLALMYHITGNKAYADDAVKRLNRYKHLTNASSRGTAPLDNGKIYLLLEAAELMRNYEGWEAADQEAFKRMLTHPFYSTTQTAEGYKSLTDSLNNVSFYWNIYQFDPGRFGNQGLFAARGLMSMGVFLDNDTIYDRAYRYLLAMSHRPDDLPYKSGPPVRTGVVSENDYKIDYNVRWESSIADYHSDEVLKYYIYQNGQCQESSRDQSHTMGGIGNYTCLAEITWNQGDSLYNVLDHRILKGIEYNTRYNLSSVKTYPDQPQPWEPTGYSKEESDCTYENGVYYQALSRSGRWESKDISPDARENQVGPGGWKTQALVHYKHRMGMPAASYTWLQRAYDHMMETYKHENWGVAPNWYYEWSGWGTLTKERPTWMVGDAGRFEMGQRISGMPTVPCTVKAVDYDYFSQPGEGYTFHNAGTTPSTTHRTDGTVEIDQEASDVFVTDMVVGEWMSYSMVFPAGEGNTEVSPVRPYNVYVTYRARESGSKLFAAVGDGEKTGKELEVSSEWVERCLGTVEVECGAATLRLFVKGKSNVLEVKDIRVEPIYSSGLQKVDLKKVAKSIRVYDSGNNDVSDNYASAIQAVADADYSVPMGLGHQKFLVFDFGENGLYINRLSLYNDGVKQDTREQASVLGETTSSPYTGAWNSSLKKDFLRTNGTLQTGLNVSILENTWVQPGTIGTYSVGPVGSYRYLALYNWSTTFNASEMELMSNEVLMINDPDSEATAEWDDADETAIKTVALPTHLYALNAGVLSCPSAVRMQAYTLQGRLVTSVASTELGLSAGLYLVRITTGDATHVVKAKF